MSSGIATASTARRLSETALENKFRGDSLAADAIERWRNGEHPNAQVFLDEHHDIDWHKSQILDLAYEEFCLWVDESDPKAVEGFLNRYSDFKNSLRRQIEVHEYLADLPPLSPEGKGQWPSIGCSVLDFTVLDELGRGSFGRVYLCSQRGLGDRHVVVKFSRGSAYEAETMGKLTHANIMPVHSIQYDEDLGLGAICMPFCGRSTLCDVIDLASARGGSTSDAAIVVAAGQRWIEPTDRFDEEINSAATQRHESYVERVIRIGIQLADAMSHAHARGVVHGDLKPSNVLITPTGRPLILDFDLASDQSALPLINGGTLPYMAPEQIRRFLGNEADDDAIGVASDVFALGVVLHELLSSKLPFGNDLAGLKLRDAGQTQLQRQSEGAPPIRTDRRRVDRVVASIVESCLSFSPEQRPADMANIAARLRRCMSWRSRAIRWSTTHRVLASAYAMVVVASLIGGITFLALREPLSVRSYKAAVSEFRRENYEEATRLATRTLVESPQDVDALYLRAMAFLKQEKFRDAREDFSAGERIDVPGRHLAGRAYSLTRMALYSKAILKYRETIDQGFGFVAAHNNLGVCYLHQGEVESARQHFDAAARLDGNRYEVYLNRAILEFNAASQSQDYLPQYGADDVRKVVSLAPPNSHIFLLAARINAILARHDARYAEPALAMFESACRRGLPTPIKQLLGDPTLAAIADMPRFKSALGAASVRLDEPPPKRLIEPSIDF